MELTRSEQCTVDCIFIKSFPLAIRSIVTNLGSETHTLLDQQALLAKDDCYSRTVELYEQRRGGIG